MLISVCVPTYHGERFLPPCLDSIIGQTFTDFELLIVDDCSSDNTLQIATMYAHKDSRIKVVSNERNLGLVANWNRCIELAKGEWVKFVFQDDLIHSQCLEKMVEAIKSNTSIVVCRRKFIFEEGTSQKQIDFFETIKDLSYFCPGQVDITGETYCKIVLHSIGFNFVGEPTTVMLNRRLFSKYGYFNENLIQICDFEYFSRVAVHEGITFIPELLATFRIHASSTSSKNHDLRKFRAHNLDYIILLHEFALGSLYRPLRIAAQRLSAPINLTDILSLVAYDTWRKTIKEPQYAPDWESVITLYPAIKILSAVNLPQRRLNSLLIKLKAPFLKVKYLLRKTLSPLKLVFQKK